MRVQPLPFAGRVFLENANLQMAQALSEQLKGDSVDVQYAPGSIPKKGRKDPAGGYYFLSRQDLLDFGQFGNSPRGTKHKQTYLGDIRDRGTYTHLTLNGTGTTEPSERLKPIYPRALTALRDIDQFDKLK